MKKKNRGFSGRSLGLEEPKYYNSPESLVFKKSEVLYNFSNALDEIKKKDKVIIHEGFFDVIKSHKAGQNIVLCNGNRFNK